MKPSRLEKVKAPVNTVEKRSELALCKCSLVPLLFCLWSWFSSDWVSMAVFLLSSKNAFFQQILSFLLLDLLLAVLPARLYTRLVCCSRLLDHSFNPSLPRKVTAQLQITAAFRGRGILSLRILPEPEISLLLSAMTILGLCFQVVKLNSLFNDIEIVDLLSRLLSQELKSHHE